MIRELFSIGPFAISPFGVMMALGFLASWLQLRWSARRLAAGDDEDAAALITAGAIGGILGGKLYYAMLYGDWSALVARAGLVWYGGAILGAAAVLLTIRLRRLPLARTADAALPSVVLGYGIGRVGCFLVGDDYGFPTDLPWGVAFRYGLPGPTTAAFMRSNYGARVPAEIPGDQLLPVHPTQLYESLAAIAIWALAIWWIRRGSGPGSVALVGFGLLAAERFGVEFLRAKDDRFFGALTLAQLLSLGVIVVVGSIAVLRLLRARGVGGLSRADGP